MHLYQETQKLTLWCYLRMRYAIPFVHISPLRGLDTHKAFDFHSQGSQFSPDQINAQTFLSTD
jgi:hypothetical protein